MSTVHLLSIDLGSIHVESKFIPTSLNGLYYLLYIIFWGVIIIIYKPHTIEDGFRYIVDFIQMLNYTKSIIRY